MTSSEKQLRGILFDFNGTLFFDDDMHIRAFRRCFETRGLKQLTMEEITHRVFGCSNAKIYHDFIDPNGTERDVEEFEKEKEGLYQQACIEMHEKNHLVAGAPELLDYLKEQGIPYCMVTGSPLCNVEFYLDAIGAGRWFSMDNVVYADGSFPGKPAPDCYRLGAEKLGLDPSECLVFEDGTAGILSARRAGVGGVVALYVEGRISPVTEEATVDREIHDLTDWRTVLSDYGIR